MPDDNAALRALQEDIRRCRECEPLFGFEPKPVVFGHQDVPIMQISQAPSLSVHRAGLPFHDQSGRKLKQQWYRIAEETFYNPDLFYLTSLAHCYPGKLPRGGDRPPPKVCLRWLDRELEQVRCGLYVLIGRRAAQYLFPGRDFVDLIFHDQTLRGRPALALPHPSPLNWRWFRDHPDFESARVPEIRAQVQATLREAGWRDPGPAPEPDARSGRKSRQADG